ncbi:MAG: hypothetical protein PHP50_09770 [Lachnospiraceae bacterium]|nr:hypothetical protein [Lachnospiraceae bacterium]
MLGSTGRTAAEQAEIEATPGYDPETYRMVLAEFGAIQPGYELADLRLVEQANGATIPPGSYNAIIYLIFYDMETNDRATSTPERLPVGKRSGEYYEVTNDSIIISTRKFSTYGIVGNTTSVSNVVETEDPETGTPVVDAVETFTEAGQSMDIQGRVVEPKRPYVYKVDITWGGMQFEYASNKEWDPVYHVYSEGALNDWREVNFDGINNKVTVVNHSNGGVQVGFSVASEIAGVEASMHTDNNLQAPIAQAIFLDPAPEGSTDAELIPGKAFLFLDGTPANDWEGFANSADGLFRMVGVITATVQPYTATVEAPTIEGLDTAE